MQLSSCLNDQLLIASLVFLLQPLSAMDQDAKRDADAKAQHEALENSEIAQFAKNKWPHFLMHMGPIANDFARGVPLREEYDRKYNTALLMDKDALDSAAPAVCFAAQCAAEKADEEDQQSGRSDNDILREHSIASTAQYFPHPEVMKTLLGLSFKVTHAKDSSGYAVQPSELVPDGHPYKDEIQRMLNDQRKHEVGVEFQRKKQEFIAVVGGALQGVMQALGAVAQHVAGKTYEAADKVYGALPAISDVRDAVDMSPLHILANVRDVASGTLSAVLPKSE